MGVKTLFLVASFLVASTLSVAAVELLNPHDVLNKTRRDMNEFDQRMKGYKAEQQKEEKEREAKRKIEEAEQQKREKAERALQEAQRKREAAEQRKREREEKALQEAQRKRDAAAAKEGKGAPPSSATDTPSQPSTGVSEPTGFITQP